MNVEGRFFVLKRHFTLHIRKIEMNLCLVTKGVYVMQTIVAKFGGPAIATPEKIQQVAKKS